MKHSKDHFDSVHNTGVKSIWKQVKNESLSFWMVCSYLIIEYVRPQSIIKPLEAVPWADICVAISIISYFLQPRKSLVKTSMNLWMLMFMATILLSCMFALWPDDSWSNIDKIYKWIVIYFLLINVVRTRQQIFIVVLIIVISSLKLSIFGARTWAMRGFEFTSWGIMGPEGFFQNSGELAIQMLVLFSMSYYLYDYYKYKVSKTVKALMLMVPLSSLMTIVASSSRGALIALAVQLYLIFIGKRISLKGVLAAIVLIALTWMATPEEQKERMMNIGQDKTSVQRLLYWENGLEMINKYPLLGVGYFNYQRYYKNNYYDDMKYKNAQLPHNIFIQVGNDAGYLGLFCYVMLIATALRMANNLIENSSIHDVDDRKYTTMLTKGLNTGFIGFIVAGQFVSVVYYPFMWIHLALIVAVNNCQKKA